MRTQHKTVGLTFGAALVLLMLIQFGFAACGGSQVTPTPTRTAKPVETATSVVPPTPTATPQASLMPTADASILTEFPSDVNPLTGLRVSDPATLDRCPLAIKISNAPAVVRPQSGLSLADLVFEHYAEGSLTRFTAIFLGHDASKVGSIRSGRLIDLEIPAMTGAMFAYSGSSGGVKQKIIASDFYQEGRVVSPDFGVGEPVFFRVPEPGKAFEHTLFTSTEALRALTTERGLNTREWAFDRELGLYRRSILGEPHTDALTGQQLTAANVIIVYANHVETDILEDLVGGGHYSIEIQIWGEGPVQIVRDGQVFDGQWARWAREDMLSFLDASGNPLPLKPGNSWYQIVPLGFPTIIQP